MDLMEVTNGGAWARLLGRSSDEGGCEAAVRAARQHGSTAARQRGSAAAVLRQLYFIIFRTKKRPRLLLSKIMYYVVMCSVGAVMAQARAIDN